MNHKQMDKKSISKSFIDLLINKLKEKYNEYSTLWKKENEYKPMTEFPPIEEGENFSELVLVFSEDFEDCDLGFYDFDTKTWEVLGWVQMELICWKAIEKPKYEDVKEYPTILIK